MRTSPALLLTLLCVCPATAAPPAEPLAAAQRALDEANPAEAVRLLRKADSAAGLLLRSTARFLLGEEAEGRRDLDKALALDPTLRQGWLNRAGLGIADGRYDAAYADLLRARELDPTAEDNDLNLGAVELLRGRLEAAMDRFRVYVTRAPGGQAHYLVSSNLARAGYAALAAESLSSAIDSDERWRARARSDANFSSVLSSPAFRDLMAHDRSPQGPTSSTARQTLAAPYDIDSGRVINAVIDGLRDAGEKVEPLVEVTEGWSIVWAGDLRARIEPGPDAATTWVTLGTSALDANWEARSQRDFRQILVRLTTR